MRDGQIACTVTKPCAPLSCACGETEARPPSASNTTRMPGTPPPVASTTRNRAGSVSSPAVQRTRSSGSPSAGSAGSTSTKPAGVPSRVKPESAGGGAVRANKQTGGVYKHLPLVSHGPGWTQNSARPCSSVATLTSRLGSSSSPSYRSAHSRHRSPHLNRRATKRRREYLVAAAVAHRSITQRSV